jgi:ABC-2 type transport system permease protein
MLLYLVYGIASPSTLIGAMWTVGIATGIIAARPDLAVTTLLTLAFFLLFNILLSRTVLSWIERLMAQRRTREIITGVLLVFALAAQAFNPALHQHRGIPYGLRKETVNRIAQRAYLVQKYLPPGLATASVGEPLTSHGSGSLPLGGLVLYTFAVTGLLGVRLRSESRGENFSETARRDVSPTSAARARRRPLLDYSGPVGAVFEKDLRYLLRSGPMLYALAVPLVMVFVLGGAFHSGFSAIRNGYALPLGIVWAFMGLTQLVSNNLGTEGHGIQFYFLSPTPMRTVMLAKNALHVVLFALEAILITGIVVYRFGLPDASVATATLAWILFAVPLYLIAGNTLSILMPYRVNMTRMRRQEFSLGNGMISMVSQALILGIGAAVLVPCALFGHRWLATPILLALAGVSMAVYLHILSRIEGMMESHREALIRDIAK